MAAPYDFGPCQNFGPEIFSWRYSHPWFWYVRRCPSSLFGQGIVAWHPAYIIFFGSTSWVYQILSNLLQSRGVLGELLNRRFWFPEIHLQRNPSLVKKDPLFIYAKWLQLPSILLDNDTQRWEITQVIWKPGPGQVLSTRVAFLTICVSWCVENKWRCEFWLVHNVILEKVHLQITWYNLTMFWLSL